MSDSTLVDTQKLREVLSGIPETPGAFYSTKIPPRVAKDDFDKVNRNLKDNSIRAQGGAAKNANLPFQDQQSSSGVQSSQSVVSDVGDDNIVPMLESGFQKLEFESSVEMLALFDSNINSGKTKLHQWQIDESLLICQAQVDSQKPLKYALCAANGSGKDLYFNAPLALWFILSKIRSRVIITSSSGVQLTSQTENYLRSLAHVINNYFRNQFGQDILKINQRYIYSPLSGSEIRLFATDEEGKAEGYHPLEPGAEMLIMVNEAKNVAPEIFRALSRCTGFTHYILVSSPGEPLGDFYNAFKHWTYKRRITYYDCPHLSSQEFESDRKEYGEHSPLFRSKWLALFTSIGGRAVISEVSLDRLYEKLAVLNGIKRIGKNWIKKVGLDLAAGGDETVLSLVVGNKQLALECFRESDTVEGSNRIDRILRSKPFNLLPENTWSYNINADDGGIGRAIIDMLVRKGWSIKRVLNQSPPKDTKNYRNRGAELWHKVARFIEEGLIDLIEDEKLISQLKSRKFKEAAGGVTKLQLEDKKDMKAEGKPSPDRADATILSFGDYTLDQLLDEVNYYKYDSRAPEVLHRKRLGSNASEIEQGFDDWMFNEHFGEAKKHYEPINSSLAVHMKHNKINRETRYGKQHSWN